MRSLLLALLVACTTAPPPPPISSSGGAPPKAKPPGDTGFSTVNWGDLDISDGPVTWEGARYTAHYTFVVTKGVHQIHLRSHQQFPSMHACAIAWQALRTRLEPRLGKSDEDNLAAYFRIPTAQITVACNPIEVGPTQQIFLEADFYTPGNDSDQ